MAKVWLVKEGTEPTTGEGFELPLASCIQLMGLQKENYHVGPDAPPRFGSSRTKVTSPRCVVVELTKPEADHRGWKQGFYLLRISVKDALKILREGAA
jgi:hypothetical protein